MKKNKEDLAVTSAWYSCRTVPNTHIAALPVIPVPEHTPSSDLRAPGIHDTHIYTQHSHIYIQTKVGVVTYILIPGTQKAEADLSLNLWPA